MTIRDNKAGLSVVNGSESVSGEIELLVAGAKQPRRVRIVERDVPETRINMELGDNYKLDLRLLPDGRMEDPRAFLKLVWRGASVTVRGEVRWLSDADVVVPRGTMARWAS